MNKKVVIAVLVLICLIATVALGEWTIYPIVDPMTSQVTFQAKSSTTYPTTKMSFPYGDTKAWLIIQYDGVNESVAILFSTSPNLTNTTINNGYYTITARVKFDDTIEEVKLYQEWLDKYLIFVDSNRVIQRMKTSKTMLLELSWFGQGKVYFNFDLTGVSDVIDTMHSKYK